MMSRAFPASSGFSLVELMVAIVAGLIVTGAAVTFTVASIRSNTEYLSATRLAQELRNSSDHIAADLKRAGYDAAAMDYVANPASTAVSELAPILIDSTAGENCIMYAYDREAGTNGEVDLGSGELRGARRQSVTLPDGGVVGVIEVAESLAGVTPDCSGAGPDYSLYPTECNAATGWCPLSDPRVLNVSTFTIDSTGSGTNSNGYQQIPASSGFNAVRLREFLISMTGNLRSDATVSRTIRSNVKVRADCLRANLAGCDVSP